MRAILAPLLLMTVAACDPVPDQVPDPADLRSRQEAACTAAIAAHVRRPALEVSSLWLSETEGVARVEARDGGRVHICEVNAAGQVLRYIHP